MTKEKINIDINQLPKPNRWEEFFEAIEMFSDDFMEDGRSDVTTQVSKNSRELMD